MVGTMGNRERRFPHKKQVSLLAQPYYFLLTTTYFAPEPITLNEVSPLFFLPEGWVLGRLGSI